MNQQGDQGGLLGRRDGQRDGMDRLAAVYEAPRLVPLGDLRSQTLGGPSGIGDSGNPGTQLG